MQAAGVDSGSDVAPLSAACGGHIFKIDEAALKYTLNCSSAVSLSFLTDEEVSSESQVECRVEAGRIEVRAVSVEALSVHMIDQICKALATRPFERLTLDLFMVVRKKDEKGSQIAVECREIGEGVISRVLEAVSTIPSLHNVWVNAMVSSEDEYRPSNFSSSLLQHLLINHSCTISSLVVINGPPLSDAETALLASALATNATSPSLKALELVVDGPRAVLRILTALEANTLLTAVSLRGNHFRSSEQERWLIYEQAITLLSVNFTLTNLYLGDFLGGDANRKATLDSMLNENASEGLAVLNTFPRVQPTSARVFFCGNAYAGYMFLYKLIGVHLYLAWADIIHSPSSGT